jgi:hypothetical protein
MLNANENPNNQPVEEVHPDPVLVGPVLPENQSTSTKKSTREKQLSNIRYTQLTGSIVLGCISTLCFHYLGAKKEDFADADANIQLGQKIVRDLACAATFSYYRVYARNEFLKHFGGLLAGTVLDSVLLLHNQKPELFAERLVANSWGTLLGLTNSVLFGKNALFPTEVVYSLANHVSHTLLHKTPSIMAVDQKGEQTFCECVATALLIVSLTLKFVIFIFSHRKRNHWRA